MSHHSHLITYRHTAISLICSLSFQIQMHTQYGNNMKNKEICSYQASSSRAMIPPGFCKRDIFMHWCYNILKEDTEDII